MRSGRRIQCFRRQNCFRPVKRVWYRSGQAVTWREAQGFARSRMDISPEV